MKQSLNVEFLLNELYDKAQDSANFNETLRDRFAMNAIAGYFPDSKPDVASVLYRCRLAYVVADAMMLARGEQNG